MTAIAATDALTGLRTPFVVERVTIPPSDLDPSLKLRVMVHHSGRKPGARPLLLLHGHPQSSIIWRDVAPALVDDGWHVVAMDLRGHGGSDAPPVRTRDGKNEPPAEEGKWRYSKREMARDCIEVMKHYGHESFWVVAHDRGARVAHRLSLDHPEAVKKMILLDIAPTLPMYEKTDVRFAGYYYHWFMLIQPFGLPEGLITGAPEAYIQRQMVLRPGSEAVFSPDVIATYVASVGSWEHAHAMAEDYRASSPLGPDLDLDRKDREAGRKVQTPTRVLWGAKGIIGSLFNGLELWKEACVDVDGHATESGHYIPEERPEEIINEVRSFF